MPDEASNIENNFNYNYLLVQTILKMRDAQADETISRYWTYFEYGMGLVISHLDFQLKGEIQQDYAILQAAFTKINNTNLNDASKKTLINRLKEDFANAHRFYIMQALNRVGIVRVEDEGVIDFESTDLDTFTKIIRDTHNTSAVGAFKAQEGKNTDPLVKPEMVLVTHKGKLIQMPKEEYLKTQQEEAPIMMGEVPADGPVVEGEEPNEENDVIEGAEEELESEESEPAEKEPKRKFGWNSKI